MVSIPDITRTATSKKKIFSDKALARVAMLAAVAIWGSAFVAIKIALTDTGPIMLAVLRFAIAAALFLPFLAKYMKTSSLPVLPLAAAGFFGVTLFFSLQNIGLYYTSAASTGLIQGSIPVFTLLFSVLLLGEKITFARGTGVICSVTGVSLVVVAGATPQAGSLLGNLLVLGSAVAWALYTIKGRALVGKVPQHIAAAGSVIFGLLFLLPFLLLEVRFVSYQPISPAAWIAVIYLGLFASGAAFFLWNYGLRSMSAAEAGTYTNLAPVVSLVTAAALLGETIGLSHLLGGSMVIAGVYLSGLSAASSKET